MSAQTALLISASSQTSQRLLRELLTLPKISQVSEYGRRVTDLKSFSNGKERLQQKVIDFEKLNEPGSKDGTWDIVFIMLGMTRKNAGSAEAFEKIDREYVINAAREAKADGKDQCLVYLSSAGANLGSLFLYTKSKGLTAFGLRSLGYKDTIIFCPVVLEFAAPFNQNVTGALSRITSGVELKVETLAKAMAKAGSEGWRAFTVIGNSGAIALANFEL
ncbi:hypothetical protein J3R30DRAFT_3671478 [Lentinula aciculospora]|uniref:NAD(P)-binding domain-containing protein n=1 Tax=Lentinula aciculospora TaxID=153920 RepID=A0A9W9DLP6_9AGAR|nr:hypothetical protein J3R30DRAFT_3671478 [Lentinula aciculospora]